MSQDRPTTAAGSTSATGAVKAILTRALAFAKYAFLFSVGVPREEYLGSYPSLTRVTLGVMYRESPDMIRVDTQGIVRYSRRMTDVYEGDEQEDNGEETLRTVRVLQVEADSPEEAQEIAERQITQCLQREGYENVVIAFVEVEPEGEGAA